MLHRDRVKLGKRAPVVHQPGAAGSLPAVLPALTSPPKSCVGFAAELGRCLLGDAEDGQGAVGSTRGDSRGGVLPSGQHEAAASVWSREHGAARDLFIRLPVGLCRESST